MLDLHKFKTNSREELHTASNREKRRKTNTGTEDLGKETTVGKNTRSIKKQCKVSTTKKTVSAVKQETITSEKGKRAKGTNGGAEKMLDLIAISDDNDNETFTSVKKKYWKEKMGLTEENRQNLLKVGKWLTSDVINPFLDLLHECNPCIRHLNPFSVYNTNNELSLDSKELFIAVINTSYSDAAIYTSKPSITTSPGSHWICVSNVCDIEESQIPQSVSVYDSMNTGTTTPDVRKFIRNLYKNQTNQKTVTIKFRKVERQTNMSACGLHSLAIATALTFSQNPELIQLHLDYKQMRNHIHTCLESEQATVFATVHEWDSYCKKDGRKISIHGETNARQFERIHL